MPIIRVLSHKDNKTAFDFLLLFSIHKPVVHECQKKNQIELIKKIMQVEVDVICTHTNFSGCSSFGDIYCYFQISILLHMYMHYYQQTNNK